MPATLAALPSTRAIPNRDVFYVADAISSHSRPVATGGSARVATSAFDDSSQSRYDNLWRISVLHLIVSFLFRITIRWINARGTWCLVAGQ